MACSSSHNSFVNNDTCGFTSVKCTIRFPSKHGGFMAMSQAYNRKVFAYENVPNATHCVENFVSRSNHIVAIMVDCHT